jgi:hypothetical protein
VLVGRTTAAALLFALAWAAGRGLDIGVDALWEGLVDVGGIGVAIAGLVLALAGLSLGAAVLRGRIALPARSVRIWLGWAPRQLPFALRDLVGRRRVSSGRDNQRWPSVAAFEGEDPRRLASRQHMQTDYGRHWRDGARLVRVSHLEATGEVVAVSANEPDNPVELLGVVTSESTLNAVLEHWGHVAFAHHDLRWVRLRLDGWRVPLPPRARWWLEEDSEPPRAWPPPPPPSVGHGSGAYHGRSADGEFEVLAVDANGQRALYHAVEWSPTGYSWGYLGAGPTDLARSLLLDRLGYVPQPPIVFSFRDDVVGSLDESFVLTYADVDIWIDTNAQLFADDPRADPLDPFAAGGA